MPNLIAALLPFVAALLALSTLRLACAAPVAHAHYVSSRQRYCAAFSGGNFTAVVGHKQGSFALPLLCWHTATEERQCC